MAAVIATIRSSLAPTAASVDANTDVHEGPDDTSSDSPVSGSMCPTAWNWSAWSRSAGSKPWPFSVIACTIVGAPYALACRRAASIARWSCPFTGPMYLMSRFEYSASLFVNRDRKPWRPPRTPR